LIQCPYGITKNIIVWFQKISHPKEGLIEIPERRGGGRVVSIGKIS